MIIYIKDAINNPDTSYDAYYHKSTLLATSEWHATDAQRGYERLKPEQGFRIVKSSWVTGDWEDAPYGHSSSEVKAEIEKLEKKHSKVYVILTPTSNVFSTSYDVLVETGEPKTKHKTVAHKTKRIEYSNGFGIRYHATEVLRYNSTNNTYTIDTGGWYTRTTKERINKYLPSPYYVYQKDFKFYLRTPTGDLDFDKPIAIKI